MRLQRLLHELAEEAPAGAVPAGLFDRARRRRRRRWSAALAAVVVLLLSGYAVVPASRTGQRVAEGPAGLPDRLVMPPWYTETLDRSPNGPASVVFDGEDHAQADDDDVKLAWWRDGYTVFPTVVVGLTGDTYRIARVPYTAGPYSAGLELSPDGRYLLNEDGIVDLTTGETRPLPQVAGPAWYEWSADGRWLVYDEQRPGEHRVVVYSWPSLRVEWEIRDVRPATRSRALLMSDSVRRRALSPDGSMLAIQDVGELWVYRRDGTVLWRRDMQHEELAGPAAWRGDGRLALLRRALPVCPACPEQPENPYPVARSLAFVDGVTGVPAAAPGYPLVELTLGLRVVAWRGDSGYAIVASTRGLPAAPPPGVSQSVSIERVTLVRLDPGAAGPRTLLTAPAGVRDMNVATDYVDAIRPAGEVAAGVNVSEIVGRVVTGALCLAPFLLPVVGLLLWRWRRRRRGRADRRPILPG